MSRLLPIPIAAEQLGLKPATVRDWIYQRKIDYVKVGRAVRISEDTVRSVIERGSIPAKRDN
jgi:excisionase family DNA binding protein